MELIQQIKEHEGFRGSPYDDHLGYPTIGYGTKLPLSEVEATLLLKHRLSDMSEELFSKKPTVLGYPAEIKEVLLEMSYQMGVPNVLKFRKMFYALDKGAYEAAADEMIDSRWYKQTPNRATKLADIVRSCI